MRSPGQLLLFRIVTRTLVVLAIAYVLTNLGIAIQRNYGTNHAIRTLQLEITALEERIAFLSNKILYLGSTAYRELEAKRRLGLKRKGEQVVLLPANRDGDDTAPSSQSPLTVDRGEPAPTGFFERASANAKTWLDWFRNAP